MKKMPGIIFTGGEGPKPEIIQWQLKNLLKNKEKPFIDLTDLPNEIITIAADSGLLLAEKAGIKPDWIIGDMDSLDIPSGKTLSLDSSSVNVKDRLSRYDRERVIRYKTDKDQTDTELAFNFLCEKGCDEIWIIGGGSGRMDHIFGIRDLFEREIPPQRWSTAMEDIHCIEGKSNGENDAGKKSRLSMRLVPDDLVSVFPLGNGPWKIESLGLKWPLDNVHWERGLYGISNVATEDKNILNVISGRFLIVLPWECNGGCNGCSCH